MNLSEYCEHTFPFIVREDEKREERGRVMIEIIQIYWFKIVHLHLIFMTDKFDNA